MTNQGILKLIPFEVPEFNPGYSSRCFIFNIKYGHSLFIEQLPEQKEQNIIHIKSLGGISWYNVELSTCFELVVVCEDGAQIKMIQWCQDKFLGTIWNSKYFNERRVAEPYDIEWFNTKQHKIGFNIDTKINQAVIPRPIKELYSHEDVEMFILINHYFKIYVPNSPIGKRYFDWFNKKNNDGN